MAKVFEGRLKRRPPHMFHEGRGQQLLIVCDIGGSQKSQPFETFSFLILDVDRNHRWFRAQRDFRSQILIHRRRMSFKNLNDQIRRKALAPFLGIAEVLNGILVTFAVHKSRRPILESSEAAREELAGLWKSAVIDRLMWVIHLGAFLVSGFAATNQNLMFIIDEDEIASNVSQLTKMTELFGRATSEPLSPMKGNLRCGTTKSDNGSLELEDLAALADLAAGAYAEFIGALATQNPNVLSTLLQQLPDGLSWKTRTILPWLLTSEPLLDRFICLVDGKSGSGTWRATIPEWTMYS